MQLTPTKLGIAVLLAFSSIGIAVGGPQLLIGPPPVTCIMRPMTKGCTLTLSKDGIFLAQVGPALETTGNDLTIQAYDGSGNYTCCLTCPDTQKISTVISTTTTVPGTTIQPTTFPLSTTTTTNPPSTAQPTTPPGTAQSTTAQASTTTPGTTGPLTTFLKSLTTATNPPSTPQPTTSPATTQVTTGQGSTIQSATTVVTLPTTSTDSVTTPLRPTTIPTTTTPSTVIWTSTTGSSTTQLPTTQSPTTPSTATDSTTIPSTTSATTAIPTTTGPCTNSSTNATARPKFDTLQEAYPTYEDYKKNALSKLKKDMGLPKWLFENGRPNTCAIRMSKAFHDAGLGIDRSRVDKSKCDTKTAGVNGKGKEYIIRALFFRCYLRAIWGPPDICDVKGEDDVKGKKGILIFTGCEGFGQHIDLWDGERCSMRCAYFDCCSSVEFYELR
ncbi:uncharacterized protein [Littorina saxatilis]|uniref:uncharacterized protein isoform X3 n=1 Tax=Littorina saxatilis TaxID=31220 RepID=UPI0038B4385D